MTKEDELYTLTPTTGEQMKSYRVRMNISQDKMAEDLLLTQATISAYERGTRAVPPDTADLLLEFGIIKHIPKDMKEDTKNIIDTLCDSDFKIVRDVVQRLTRRQA